MNRVATALLCWAVTSIGICRPIWACECAVGRCSCSNSKRTVDDGSCEVVSRAKCALGSTLARECESIRAALQTQWLGKAGQRWQPKCVIVLHPSRDQYRVAVGRNGLMTYGCSRVTFDGDRVVGRRIDLCGDDDDRARSALSHELCHLVLADHFGRHAIPKWADEGIAVLADSAGKQARHERDFRDAVAAHAHIPFAELAADKSLSSSDRAAVFYGQSASLVHFLVRRKRPQDLLTFVGRIGQVGYDRAAKEVYGFTDVRSLEVEWLADVHQRASDGRTARSVPVTAASTEQQAHFAR